MSGLELLRIGISMMPQRTLPVAGVLAATLVIATIWWESAFNEPAEDLY